MIVSFKNLYPNWCPPIAGKDSFLMYISVLSECSICNSLPDSNGIRRVV